MVIFLEILSIGRNFLVFISFYKMHFLTGQPTFFGDIFENGFCLYLKIGIITNHKHGSNGISLSRILVLRFNNPTRLLWCSLFYLICDVCKRVRGVLYIMNTYKINVWVEFSWWVVFLFNIISIKNVNDCTVNMIALKWYYS